MPFLAFLQKIFHPVLRILGMSADPPNTDEFPKRMSVEDWRRGLVNMYTSRDLELGPKYRARMPRLQVIRIRRYKERKSPRHEYLVAEIAVPESERRYLLLERSARDSVPAESSGANKEVFHPISNGSQSSLAISSNLAAMDDVRTITGWPIDSCIDKVDCENLPEPITLLDLAIAAELVHNNSDKYEVISRQCFWYADTVSAVLETYFPNVKIQYRPKLSLSADVNHTENEEDGIHEENSGKFMQISFHKRQQGDVDQIVGVFRERKSTITDSIAAAAAAVGDTLRMQEDTERRAEEAQKQAEDAKRQAEEAKKEVKDLEKVNQMLAHRIHELEAGSNGQSSYIKGAT